ncbi:hypothetical protein H0H92_005849, partial [Tricholoma furcatifolium]
MKHWDGFLSHYRIRPPSDPASAPAGIRGLLPPPEHDKYLWRVSVKRGREEALAFTLFNKAIASGSKVSSVTGRLSTPGWIYVETKDLKDVQELCTDVIDIHVKKIVSIPSKDAPSILREVHMFADCPLISTTIIANARLMLDALRLQSGDPVKVIEGDTRGAVGHVVDVDANLSRATIALLEGPTVDVSLDVLRKTLSIGDSIEVAPHQLIFYEEKKTIYKTTGSVNRPIPQGQSPNERFVGREVKIIRGPFKDYEGRIKNTERGDVLNVEIQATMQQRQFSMEDLAHLHDPQLRPLIAFAHQVGDLPEFKADERMLPPMPPSSRPLVPSTPIPEGSSAEMGRAWNPSSRTPNPLSGFPCNSYMDSPHLNEELRVHVQILGTKPVLNDPGWKLGDFEGRRGLWCKHDNDKAGFACVQFGLRHMEHLPE